MSSSDIWQFAYLIALARGCTTHTAKTIANQAVEDWEEFECDTA